MALWHFLACFIFTSCLVAGQQTRYVLKGLKVNLNPGVSKTPDNILWMHNGNKVVEFDGQQEDVYDPFKNRITLYWQTAELSIDNLGFQDTGDYVLEAWVDGKLNKSEFSLEVIDEVHKPTISCELTDCSSSNKSATLVCATDAEQPHSSIKFEWSSHGNTQPGSKLTIPLGKENDDEVYTCTVSNALSAETATFTVKDCYSDCSSVAPIIIPVIILVIALLLVGLVVIIMYCKRHHKACFAEAVTGDVEKQLKSGVTQGSPEETQPLVNKASTPSSNQQQHQGGGKLRPDEAANSPRGDTDSDQDSAEVNNTDSQAKTPQKGYVKKMKGLFDSPGTKESPDKKWLKEKEKHKPEETALSSPSKQSEAPSPSNENNLSSSAKGDSDADQLGKQETEIPHSDNQDTESNVESSTSPEQPEKNSDKPKETALPSPSQQSEAPSPSDQNNLSSSDKGDSDADHLGKQETEISQSNNEADQPDVLSSNQDTESKVESSTSPEQPEKNSDKPKETALPSPPQQSEAPSPSNENNLSSSDKGESDADQLGKEQTEIPHSDNEAVQPGVLSSNQDTESNVETSTSPEQPEKNSGKPKETALPSPSQQSEAPSPSDENNLSSSDKGDSDADQLGKEQTEIPHSDNEADQPGVLSSNQDTESNVETSTSPEQPGSPEETQPLVNKASTPSSDQQQHQGGGKLRPDEAANSPRGDTDSDQDSAEVNNTDSQAEMPQKGFVKKRRSLYEPPGTKDSPRKKWLKESKKTDEDEKGKSPTDGDSPAAGETTDEQKEDANSVQIHGGTEGGSGDSSPSDVEKTNKSDTSEESSDTAQSKKDQKVDSEKMKDSDESTENQDEEHKESKKVANDDEEVKSPTNGVSPTAEPSSP